MNSTLRILCVGKIVNGPIDWTIAPPPEPEPDGTFDAPSECSYFAHLFPEPDGTIQDLIDIANADILAEEWQEFWQDQAWMNTGLS